VPRRSRKAPAVVPPAPPTPPPPAQEQSAPDGQAPGLFRNRIVRTAMADPATLVANPLNWRKHPKAQVQALDGVLGELGWIDTVIVNERSGRLIDGHLRVEIAVKRKEQAIPVQYVDLDDNEERLALATFDPISAMASHDSELLAQLIASVEARTGSVADLLNRLNPAKSGDGSLLELADVTIADPAHVVEYGDVYDLGGRHVLVVADVIDGWRLWAHRLEGDVLFCPYPGPYVALTVTATIKRMLLVQPDAYLAGHVLDQYARAHGPTTVRKTA
jgi:hypothetical protein